MTRINSEDMGSMKVLLVSEGKHEECGALETFVRRIAKGIESYTWDKVSRNDIHTHRGRGQGFFKRAVRWILEAKKRDFDALVLVIDEDGYPDRISELDQAQSEEAATAGFPRCLGIAVRSFDAWMLADERAIAAVLGYVVPAQGAPEENHHPKEDCAKLLSGKFSQADFYARIAATVNVQLLESRCPKGFGVFADRLRKL